MKPENEVLLIIPAYNEAGNIEAVVDGLQAYPMFDYVVVTDGPTDGTDEICRRRGYNTVYLPVNLGLTGCFRTGMKFAWTRGYSYAVQFDGDGQHLPEYIAPMYEKIKEGYDIVLGSRFLAGEDVRGIRGAGSRFLRSVVRLTTGFPMTDPTCGLRMYSRKIIRKFSCDLNCAPEPDTLAFLIRNGSKVAEVPVKVRERTSGESYLKPFKAVGYMIRMTVSILFFQIFRDPGPEA